MFDPNTFLFTAENKEGTSRRKGVELEFTANPTNVLALSANYSYTDAYEQNPDGTESPEVRRPKHMGSVNLNWYFAQRRGTLNLNVNYNGSQLDNIFPPPFFAPVSLTLDSYVLVDLAAAWRLNRNFEVYGRVTNLLDEHYEEVVGFSRPGIGVYAGIRVRL